MPGRLRSHVAVMVLRCSLVTWRELRGRMASLGQHLQTKSTMRSRVLVMISQSIHTVKIEARCPRYQHCGALGLILHAASL